MNCQQHPDTPAVAYCRQCGKAVCQVCQRVALGTVFCAEHVPAAENAPRSAPAPFAGRPADASPGLAFVLGLIPGVGAIYNAQYAKGVIHVVILGLLISITNSGTTHPFEALFGLLIAIWYFYMPFEAYHTARKRQLGEPADEFSSLFPLRPQHTGVPVGPIVLIALGVLFLLNTMELVSLDRMLRYWPVFLIALGVYMLYCRLTGRDSAACCPRATEETTEVHHEQQQ